MEGLIHLGYSVLDCKSLVFEEFQGSGLSLVLFSCMRFDVICVRFDLIKEAIRQVLGFGLSRFVVSEAV